MYVCMYVCTYVCVPTENETCNYFRGLRFLPSFPSRSLYSIHLASPDRNLGCVSGRWRLVITPYSQITNLAMPPIISLGVEFFCLTCTS